MTGIWYLSTFDPRIVYIPFVDMIRGPVDTVLNIILFIPLGIFLPLLYKKYDKIGKIVLIGFEGDAGIYEETQYIFEYSNGFFLWRVRWRSNCKL